MNTASGVAETLADSLSDKTNYMINRMTYKNEKKIAEFDTEISRLTNRDKKNKIQAASDKKVAALQKKKDKASDDKEKSQN